MLRDFHEKLESPDFAMESQFIDRIFVVGFLLCNVVWSWLSCTFHKVSILASALPCWIFVNSGSPHSPQTPSVSSWKWLQLVERGAVLSMANAFLEARRAGETCMECGHRP